MKWIFYVLVTLYMIYKAVYGEGLEIHREEDSDNIWSVGEKHEILCIGTNKNQKLRWKDPEGNNVDRRRAGSRVYSQERAVHGSMPTLALIFIRVSTADTGRWSCHAGEWEQYADVCVMDVADFVSTVTEVTTDQGRAITLSCEARGKPEPLLLWYRDGNLITDEYVEGESSKYKLMPKYNVQGYESLLTVSYLEPSDAGVYVCAAVQDSDLCTSNHTLNITINVNHPPTILSQGEVETLYVNYDENVTLLCEAYGYPNPIFTWYQRFPDRDIKLESGSDRSIMLYETASEIQFLVDNRTAHQLFVCSASNRYGNVEKSYQIVPLIAPMPPDRILLVNETDTEVTFRVYWTSTLLPSADEIVFPIKALKVQYMKKNLVPGGKPWREADWGRAKIVSIDESNLFGDIEGMTFSVDGLTPDTTYWLRICVYNDAGFSNWSKHVKFSTSTLIGVMPTTEQSKVNKKGDDEVKEAEENTERVEDAEILLGTTDKIAISEDEEALSAPSDASNFYALVFGVSIVVVIGGCTFIMKKM